MGKAVRKRLIEERKRHGWSQQELADLIGTTQNNISRWEMGSTTPGPFFRAKLCELFGQSAQALGLLNVDALPLFSNKEEAAAAESTGSSSGDEPILWTIPYPRNPHFTGRDDLLDRLEQHFSPGGSGVPDTTRQAVLPQSQAIKGLGGIGKTQIAVEYAYRAFERGCYKYAFWVNAASEEAIMTSLVVLAALLPNFPVKDEKDQRKLVAAIKRWLEQCPQRWLLIFDNADDISLIQEYLPQRGNGSILITTRANAIGSLAASLEVEQMGLVEGTQLLLHRSQRLHATDEEYNEATNVVIALDGFPLALDQAGAYIEETRCSFGDYLQLYREQRQALLARRGRQATNYPDSVATTWTLSFRKVEQGNPAAAELLRLCAFLAPDHIPEELFKEGAPHWPPMLQQAVGNLFAFNQMLEALLTFSLVKRLQDEQMLSVHRLVQAVQRDTFAPEEQHQWAECVVCAVNTLFPRDPKEDIATWPQCLRYLEQVQICDTLIQQHSLVLPEAADLLTRTGIYLLERAFYPLAEPLFRRALHIWEQQPGPEHTEMAETLGGLAHLYRNQGKYGAAESLFQRALRIWEQQLGPDHARVGSMLNNLALVFYDQGKFAEAEPLFHQARRIWEQQNHPKVAYALNGLANLYYKQGKFAEARSLYQGALDVWEQQLGPDHPLVAAALNNLAILDNNQGKTKEAEHLYQQALRIWETQLGPDHAQTAYALINLANLYYQQGKVEEAEPLYQRVLTIWEQQLGPEHPLMAHPLNGLADVYRRQRHYTKAEILYERAWRIREQLDSSHPDKAETLQGQAALREAQGQCQEAARLYQRALAIREQVFGAQHPKTQETRAAYTTLLQRSAGNQSSDEHGSFPISERDHMGNGAGSYGEWRGDALSMPPCPHCHSHAAVSKNGTNRSGTQRFRCRSCSSSFTPHVRQQGHVSSLKDQAVALKAQGNSDRAIARTLGVDHHTIRRWLLAAHAEQ